MQCVFFPDASIGFMKLRQNKLAPIQVEAFPSESLLVENLPGGKSGWDRAIEKLERIRADWLQQNACGLGPHLLRWPEAHLHEYSSSRGVSLLGRIFRFANQIQSNAERFVVVGNADIHLILRCLMEACCDPYWNELSRAERGSKPRIYFAGESFDNDALQGLLYLLSRDRPENRYEELGWGGVMLATSDSGESPRLASGFLRTICEPLWIECCVESEQNIGENTLGLPSGVPALFAAFTAAGLLPAAILGINIMELLAGAAWTTRLFATESGSGNPILRWVAWNHLISHWYRSESAMDAPSIALWNSGLSACGDFLLRLEDWHSTSVHARASNWRAMPLGLLRAPLQAHSGGLLSRWWHHHWVDAVRCDALSSIQPTVGNDCGAASGSETQVSSYPDLVRDQFESTIAKQISMGASGLVMRLPDLGELSLGQWLQWHLLATLLESHLESDTCEHSSES